jgi:hypothetical protein
MDDPYSKLFEDPGLPEEALPSYLDTLPDAVPIRAPKLDEAVDSPKMKILVLNLIFLPYVCLEANYQ